jgi:FkbH-like protein
MSHGDTAEPPQATGRLPPADPSGPTDFPDSLFAHHNGPRYRTPVDLQVTPDSGGRYLVIGGCLAQPFPEMGARLNPAMQGDFLLLNNLDVLPPIAAERAAAYDFQIVHLPLRTILGSAYFRLPDELAAHEEFLRETEEYVERYLANALRLNEERKLTSFVLGFLVPQQNPLGRFQPRYDLRNVVHFIERLNVFLAAQLAKRENTWFVDLDQISSGIGKRLCQDDMVWSYTHGTTLSDGDHDHDLQRLHAPSPMQDHYAQKWVEFFEATLHEVFAMARTLRGSDPVKLVVVDLDDTLWRGVAAEGTLGILEGWPLGFIEALLILKRRGILLGIVSKNDENFIRAHWERIVQGQISLDDFAAFRINFRSKVVNLASILAELNLRPQNVIMIDDHPAERAAVQAAMPKVRVLGQHPYYLKRVLLWAAETQSSTISAESSLRTQMVQAQVRRESSRRALAPAQFLATLELEATIARLESTGDLEMSRALELLNKTNQFNTTGERHTLESCHRRFVAGHVLYVLHAQDRFTRYGLVGAAWCEQGCIEQLVMSCRVLGLGLEDAFLAHIAPAAVGAGGPVRGRLRHTGANVACRSFYSGNGFMQTEDPALWVGSQAKPLRVPAHVKLRAQGSAEEWHARCAS